MRSRAEIVDENFISRVRARQLPKVEVDIQPDIPVEDLLDLFESQMMSRHLDIAARVLKAQGESFYTIGSAGHEGNAVFGKVFRPSDPAFLHYRSGAFYVQRAKELPGSTPLYDVLLSLVASADDPIAGGRHKVFGSVLLNIPPQTSTIASHLPKAVGAALSIRRAFDLKLTSKWPQDSVVLCSFGDATINHATALSGFNTAEWCVFQNLPLPLVWICEDNGLGISVKTPLDWVERRLRGSLFKYYACDGRNLLDVWQKANKAADFVRRRRQPVFLHMKTVRLLGHAGSDVETLYRSLRDIESTEAEDPLLYSAGIVLSKGYLNSDEIIDMYESIRARVARISALAAARPKLMEPKAIMASVIPPAKQRQSPEPPGESTRRELFGSDWRYMKRPQNMAKLINWALHDLMLRYGNTLVFGEDVAQKGGVYHVTSGLTQKFGARRVFNSPLDETSILGTAIGFAHNGFIPIPEIQFLAYLHNAEDQLRGEAATLSFFSQGQYTNPMVVRIAALAYQKGFGGHFHNDNSVAVLRDIPGVIIACPAHGADAVRMLRSAVRAAHEDGRVVVFLEPIARYMTKDLHRDGDGGWSHVYPPIEESIDIGAFGISGSGDDLAIVTYGNGVFLSEQAAEILRAEHGVKVKVIDLRWLAPLDEHGLTKELAKTESVLIVEECRRTGGIQEAIAALVASRVPGAKWAVIAAEDCFIPLGRGATALLPSREGIVRDALSLVGKRPIRGRQSRPKPGVSLT